MLIFSLALARAVNETCLLRSPRFTSSIENTISSHTLSVARKKSLFSLLRVHVCRYSCVALLLDPTPTAAATAFHVCLHIGSLPPSHKRVLQPNENTYGTGTLACAMMPTRETNTYTNNQQQVNYNNASREFNPKASTNPSIKPCFTSTYARRPAPRHAPCSA